MHKDYDTWNSVKKVLELNSRVTDFHERELWWMSLGLNVGIEIDGKHESFERPVLVLVKFNRDMAWILPTTSQMKSSRFHEPVTLEGKTYYVALTQIRTVSAKRFLKKEGTISKDYFLNIRNRVIDFLKSNKDPREASPYPRRPKP